MVEMLLDGMGLIGEEVKIFDGNLNDQVTIEGPKLHKKEGLVLYLLLLQAALRLVGRLFCVQRISLDHMNIKLL